MDKAGEGSGFRVQGSGFRFQGIGKARQPPRGGRTVFVTWLVTSREGLTSLYAPSLSAVFLEIYKSYRTCPQTIDFCKTTL